jgi:hypothetical protein
MHSSKSSVVFYGKHDTVQDTDAIFAKVLISKCRSIDLYMSEMLSIPAGHWKRAPKSILLSPSLTGSLISDTTKEKDVGGITYAHSGLFRVLIYTRDYSNLPVPNELFYKIAKTFPALERLEEVNL